MAVDPFDACSRAISHLEAGDGPSPQVTAHVEALTA
jgi:hypothetical protein